MLLEDQFKYCYCIKCKRLSPVKETVTYDQCRVCNTPVTNLKQKNTPVFLSEKEAEIRNLPVVKGE